MNDQASPRDAIARLPLEAPGGRDAEVDPREGENAPADGAGPRLLAVIEASRGSASKFKYEPALGVFTLHAVLAPGLVYPCDFGFLPATLGDDGDPLDVLLLADEPVPVGGVVPCRLLGVLEAEQADLPQGATPDAAPGAKRRKAAAKPPRFERNDRMLAVAARSHRHGHCRSIDDVPAHLLDLVERFLVAQAALRGIDFRPIGRGGPAKARALVRRGAKRAAPGKPRR